MANRSKVPAQSYGVGREYMALQFKLNGASAPTVTYGKGYVASATHTGGTNVVTVTMTDAFVAVVSAHPDLRDDAGNGAYASIGTITNEGKTSALTFKIQTFAAGGSAANDSSAVIGVLLCLTNSNVTQGN